MNFKKGKPRKFSKLFRNGTDGIGCSYCGSNWLYRIFKKRHLIKWEKQANGEF